MKNQKNFSITHLLNEKGSLRFNIIATIVILLLVLIGIATVYDSIAGTREFTEEEITVATNLAQNELSKTFTATKTYRFEDRVDGIMSIGYKEPTLDDSTMIFEKTDKETNTRILLKLLPHESYDNLTRVLIQVFDKKDGALMTETENVLTWQK